MDERRQQAVRDLVAWHFKVEPELREVYVLVGAEGEPIVTAGMDVEITYCEA